MTKHEDHDDMERIKRIKRIKRINKEIRRYSRRCSGNERLLRKVFTDLDAHIKEHRSGKPDEIRDIAAEMITSLGEITIELYQLGRSHIYPMSPNTQRLTKKVLANLRKAQKSAEDIRHNLGRIDQDEKSDITRYIKRSNDLFLTFSLKNGRYSDAEMAMRSAEIDHGDDKPYMERLVNKFRKMVPDSYFSDMQRRLKKEMKRGRYNKAEIIIEHAQLVFPDNMQLQERLVAAYKALLPSSYTPKF